MATKYSVYLLHSATGVILADLSEFLNLEYAQRTNFVGSFRIILRGSFDVSLAALDSRLVVYRQPSGYARSLDFAGFIRGVRQFRSNEVHQVELSGVDYNELLTRRIIAYAAGSAEADKAGTADDIMKEYFDENFLGSATDTNRDLSDYGISMAAVATGGTAVEITAAWENVMDTFQAISDASQAVVANAVYFGMVPLTDGYDMEFRTKPGQWGMDHRFPDGVNGAVWFALERGNLKDPAYQADSFDELTYAYAGGSGEGASREVVEVTDTDRVGASLFNRREAFYNGSGDETDELVDGGYVRMEEGPSTRTFNFEAVQTPGALYGVHYHLGDRVTATYRSITFDPHVAAVDIKVEPQVGETIKCVFEEIS